MISCPNCQGTIFTYHYPVRDYTCQTCNTRFKPNYEGRSMNKSAFAPPMIGEKDESIVNDGGTKFETGAVRSADKQGVQYHLISPIGLRRLAETHKEGTDKYGFFNWERGMPIGDLLNHAIAHIYAYLSGVPSVDAKTGRVEDDLAHAAWNLFAAMHMEETHPDLNHQLRFALKWPLQKILEDALKEKDISNENNNQ